MMTIKEATTYYEVVAATQKAHSWKYWLRTINREWAERDITSITTGDVNAFIARRRQEGKAEATIKSQLNTIRQLFHVANDHGVECEYPKRVARIVVNNDRCRAFEGDEEQRLRRVMHPKDFLIVELGFSTGMRGAEMWNVEKRDVNLTQGFIHIRDGKGGFSRRVPIGKTSRKVLKALLEQSKNSRYLINPEGFEGFSVRKSMMEAWKARVFRPACRAAKIDARFHDLTRHEFATRVVRMGKSLYVVQRALGHASPNMTMRYSHLSDRDLKDAVATL